MTAQTQLNQIVALEKDVKVRATSAETAVYHGFQRTPQLTGIARTYTPKDDEGDKLPAESTLVQVKVEDLLTQNVAELTRLFDLTFTKETANTQAKADVVVDGTALLTNVPLTYLLFLEKQLTNLRTITQKVPTLDPAETWHFDSATNTWATAPSETTRSKKVMRNHVKAEATDKHPAQVEVYTEDVIVGTWKTVKFSGAVPVTRKQQITDRIDILIQAVKRAREIANGLVVVDKHAGEAVLSFIYAQ